MSVKQLDRGIFVSSFSGWQWAEQKWQQLARACPVRFCVSRSRVDGFTLLVCTVFCFLSGQLDDSCPFCVDGPTAWFWQGRKRWMKSIWIEPIGDNSTCCQHGRFVSNGMLHFRIATGHNRSLCTHWVSSWFERFSEYFWHWSDEVDPCWPPDVGWLTIVLSFTYLKRWTRGWRQEMIRQWSSSDGRCCSQRVVIL